MLIFTIVILLCLFFLIIMLSIFVYTFVRRNDSKIDDLNSKHNLFLSDYKSIMQPGLDFIDSQKHVLVYSKSFDELKLAARYYPNKDSKKTIILFHGYRSSGKRDFACAVKIYYQMGLNVLIPDQRSHGKSDGKLITFGVKERFDVLTWIDFVLNKIDKSTDIFLGGMSMGSTTVLLSSSLGLPTNVKGIIADCGFTSPVNIIKKVAKQRLNINCKIIIPVMDTFCKIFGKFSIRNISTVDALKKNKIPILMFHGKKDGFVPYQMSEENYAVAMCEKELYLVENADHGFSYIFDTNGVTEKINKFIMSH